MKGTHHELLVFCHIFCCKIEIADFFLKHHIGVTLYEKQQILLCPN